VSYFRNTTGSKTVSNFCKKPDEKKFLESYFNQEIKSLGVNALWLNPIFESGWFDGGYDVIDFYKVDPRFGTNTDLVTLVNEAHKRGIKVCLDLVAGHSSTKCAWFKESSEKDPNQRYSDYYIWMNDIPESEKNEIERLENSRMDQPGLEHRHHLLSSNALPR
jgi:maltose alpha-D-glucosyltransferase/alpha-amylase